MYSYTKVAAIAPKAVRSATEPTFSGWKIRDGSTTERSTIERITLAATARRVARVPASTKRPDIRP